jgi:transketolase
MMLNKLERRIIDISYRLKLSHISSCLMACRLIDNIYKIKAKDDIFILSNGHCGLALYVVLEKYEGQDAEKLFKKHGVHPNRDLKAKIYASTGSLGHGLGIAVGMALANRKRNVFVLISDGECAEGSISEALRIATENRLENLRIMLMANSMGAYGQIDLEYLKHRIQTIYPILIAETNMFRFPSFLNGQQGHYIVLNQEQYKELITL